MAVKLGSARIDERGRASGGKAGDQTGKEVSTQSWYKHSKGWRVLRPIDAQMGIYMAEGMQDACDNSNIGYDQSENQTAYKAASKIGFVISDIKTPVETDCARLVRLCVQYAYAKMGINKTVPDFYTANECSKLLSTGYFVELTDSKYTNQSEYLRRGDVLCTKTKGHTVIVLTSGSKVENLNLGKISIPAATTTTSSNTATVPQTEGESVVMGLTNVDFVNFLKGMVGQPYWYGTCVYACTESLLTSKTKQYPAHYTSARMSKYKDAIAKKCVAADCVGLGKGFVWTNGGVGVLEAIGTGKSFKRGYGTNGCPDQSANGMFNYAKSHGKKYGKISTIPETPGLAVRKDGHVGYYIGDGKVIEAYGFAKGIVITNLKSRPWTDWYEFPGIEYTNTASTTTTTAKPTTERAMGDRLLREGYTGSDVKELQQALIDLNYHIPENAVEGTLKATGTYDAETVEVVKFFQTYNKLEVDGIAGPETFAAIKKGLGYTDPNDTKDSTTTAKDYSSMPTLRKGAEGEEVKILQQELISRGYDLGKDGADGEFGNKTLQAVRKFQEDCKIKVDGIVGRNTWNCLSAQG